MERRTHFERIVGGTQEEKQAVSEKLQNVFDKKNAQLARHKMEKSTEDIAIIKKTEAIVDGIVKRYGGKIKPLPLDHIYVLKPGSLSKIDGGRFSGGIHSPLGVKVGAERGKSALIFAHTLAHELFHLKSCKAAGVGRSGVDPRLYRSGLSMIDRKEPDEKIGEEKEYFAILEEAIVAECAKKFDIEMSEGQGLGSEAAAMKQFKDWVVAYGRRRGMSEETAEEFKHEVVCIADVQDKVKRVLGYFDNEEKRQGYAAGMFDAMFKSGEVEVLERYHERKQMYALLDKIIGVSGGRFKNRDEVFDEFARANFSGNYLPLAKIVESVLGKGSFRKIAEEFAIDHKPQDNA